MPARPAALPGLTTRLASPAMRVAALREIASLAPAAGTTSRAPSPTSPLDAGTLLNILPQTVRAAGLEAVRNPEMALAAVEALCSCGDSSEPRLAALLDQMVGPLLEQLRQSMSRARAAEMALVAIGLVCRRHPAERRRSLFVMQGAAPLLASFLHDDDSHVVYAALTALYRMAIGNDRSRTRAISQAVNKQELAMLLFDEDGGCAGVTAALLSALCAVDEDCSLYLCRTRGLPRLLELMRRGASPTAADAPPLGEPPALALPASPPQTLNDSMLSAASFSSHHYHGDAEDDDDDDDDDDDGRDADRDHHRYQHTRAGNSAKERDDDGYLADSSPDADTGLTRPVPLSGSSSSAAARLPRSVSSPASQPAASAAPLARAYFPRHESAPSFPASPTASSAPAGFLRPRSRPSSLLLDPTPTHVQIEGASAASALASVCLWATARRSVFERDAVAAICEVLGSPTAIPSAKHHCAAMVANLCAGDETYMHEALVESGVVDALHEFLRSGTPTMIAKATSALRNLSGSTPLCQDAIVRSGVVPWLVRQLRSRDAHAQAESAVSIANLCHGGNHFANIICSHGAVPALIALLGLPGSSDDDTSSATSPLSPTPATAAASATQLRFRRAWSGGESGAAADSANDHDLRLRPCREAAGALRNLSALGSRYQNVIWSEGGIPRLVELLSGPDLGTCEEVAATLRNLSALVVVRRDMLDAGLAKAVAQLLDDEPPDELLRHLKVLNISVCQNAPPPTQHVPLRRPSAISPTAAMQRHLSLGSDKHLSIYSDISVSSADELIWERGDSGGSTASTGVPSNASLGTGLGGGTPLPALHALAVTPPKARSHYASPTAKPSTPLGELSPAATSRRSPSPGADPADALAQQRLTMSPKSRRATFQTK